MDRRTLLTSIAGAAAAGGTAATDSISADGGGRPTLALDGTAKDQWRVRSWQWTGGAWQPRIAHARRTATGFDWSGSIDPIDRVEAESRLRG